MRPYKKGEPVWVYESQKDSIREVILYDDENLCPSTGERFVQISSCQIKNVWFVARSRKALLRKLTIWLKAHIKKQYKEAEIRKAEIDREVQETASKLTALIKNN